MGTGQNSTTILLHEDKFARGDKISQRQFFTKVNFARVTILHESKKKSIKINI